MNINILHLQLKLEALQTSLFMSKTNPLQVIRPPTVESGYSELLRDGDNGLL